MNGSGLKHWYHWNGPKQLSWTGSWKSSAKLVQRNAEFHHEDTQAGSGTINGAGPINISLTESDLRDYLIKTLENTGDPSFKPLIRDILSGFGKK